MEITLKPTSDVVPINDAPCRIWKGHTADGVTVVAFIAVIGAPDPKHSAEFVERLADHVQSKDCPGANVSENDLRLGR